MKRLILVMVAGLFTAVASADVVDIGNFSAEGASWHNVGSNVAVGQTFNNKITYIL